MAKVLSEYFGAVKASDIQPYGYGDRVDFLTAPYHVKTLRTMTPQENELIDCF